jgi:hypothetical protein
MRPEAEGPAAASGCHRPSITRRDAPPPVSALSQRRLRQRHSDSATQTAPAVSFFGGCRVSSGFAGAARTALRSSGLARSSP